MFDEILSDGKGPSFFGFSMGAFVLISFVCLGKVTLDEQYQGGPSIHFQLREQKALISELKRETEQFQVLSEERRFHKMETERLEKSNSNVAAAITRMIRSRLDLDKKNTETKVSLEVMVSTHRAKIRSKAVGEKISQLETLSGKKYQDVTIRFVTASGIAIRHEAGTASIKADDLNETFWVRFDFNLPEMEKYELETESLMEASDKNFYSNQNEIQRSQAEVRLEQVREKLESLVERKEENLDLIRLEREGRERDEYGNMLNSSGFTITDSKNASARLVLVREEIRKLELTEDSLEQFLGEK